MPKTEFVRYLRNDTSEENDYCESEFWFEFVLYLQLARQLLPLMNERVTRRTDGRMKAFALFVSPVDTSSRMKKLKAFPEQPTTA